MGYDLHITRKDFWADEGEDISIEEWLKVIEDDSELTLESENGLYFATWKPINTYEEYWFDWNEGQLYSKNPEDITIQKMVSIANILGAKVQGDDGEIYEGNRPDELKSIKEKKKPLLKKIFGLK